MKAAYRLVNRNGMFYVHDNATGLRTSLQTKDRSEAEKLLEAKNHRANGNRLSLALGKAYLAQIDPELTKRTWQDVFNFLANRGKETSRERWKRVMRSKPFASLLNKLIVETTSSDFNVVLNAGGNFTNQTLRLLQSTACGLSWLHLPIIPPKLWPKTHPKPKRAVTAEEHAKIIVAEKNDERRQYYEFLWETGTAQSDAANLTANAIDWKARVIAFNRMKTGSAVHIRIGEGLEQLLLELPQQGFLFPTIANTSNKDRAAEFCRRLRTIGVSGISLHSYRYSWAERARTAGYPERFAQAALGHNSRAVHQSYPVIDCSRFA